MKKIIHHHHHKHKANNQPHTYHINNHKNFFWYSFTKKKLFLLSILLLIVLFIGRGLFISSKKTELLTNQKQYYYGVGIGITFNNGRAVVSRVIPGTPAEKAGIQLNDIITAVDLVPISPENSRNLCKEIRGQINNSVNLSIERQKTIFDKKITRAKIYSRTPTMCQ